MNTIGMFALLFIFSLSGCTLTGPSDRQSSLLNPPGLHVSASNKSSAALAGKIPITQYYSTLEKAKDMGPGSEIDTFVDKGVGLVNAYCLRWFQRLDDAQRKADLREKDVNVIRSLGTTLLGLGKAIPNWVTGYGALNTAYSGVSENFNEAVLAGPTTAKVKEQMLAMLKQSETKLRNDATNLTFSQAYSRIELHADTCTHSTIRSMLDSTLSNTKTKRDPDTGKITTEPFEATFQFDEASSKLQDFWRPKGVTNQANEVAITQWLAQNGISGVSVAFLINTSQFASLRTKAIKDLKL